MENKALIFYATEISERLRYIVRWICQSHWGVTYILTDDLSLFEHATAFRINYSKKDLSFTDLHILPHDLLFENDIREQLVEMSEWQDLPIFFEMATGDMPFDMFAASFYLLSRYEEYLETEVDAFGRYPIEKSLAYRNQFLHQALVDRWILALKNIIQQKDPSMVLMKPQAQWIPTYDIDIAYSYRGKGWLRNGVGFLRDAIKGKWDDCAERWAVLRGRQKDPFDAYAQLDAWHVQYHLAPIYFFLLGKRGKYDKNLAPQQPLMQQLIKNTMSKYAVGIHPSYRSHAHSNILQQELRNLPTHKSRQHYIKFSLPHTFRTLIHSGIEEDYSMGYGSGNGFRASTSFSHDWFDLKRNEMSSLRLIPFCYMECNSRFEQQYDSEQAFTEMMSYWREVSAVGGTMVSIWHNFSLGSSMYWTGWASVYQRFLEEVFRSSRTHQEAK